MMQLGVANAAKPAWDCSTPGRAGQLHAGGISAKHAILALKAKLSEKSEDPSAIEKAVCKNSKTKQTKTYTALKSLLGDGPHGEKSGS